MEQGVMGWDLSNITVLSSIIAKHVGGLRIISSATIDEVGGRSVTDEVWGRSVGKARSIHFVALLVASLRRLRFVGATS